MPGIFCDAMVTRNSGTPSPIAAANVNTGRTNTGAGQSEPDIAGIPCIAIKPTTTSTAAGTAYKRLK